MSTKRKIEKVLLIGIIGFIVVLSFFRNNVDSSPINKLSSEVIEETSAPVDDVLIVHVAGEVVRPGVYEFVEGERLKDAIERAGGVTDCAASDKLNLATRLTDEMKILVPSIHDDVLESTIETLVIQTVDTDKININTADAVVLMDLPGIGPKTADKIIEYRENSPFEKVEDIKNVNGIGDKMFETIKDLIDIK